MINARFGSNSGTLFSIIVQLLLIVCCHTFAFANDIRFSSGNRALSIPFELEDNLIYVPVSINGSKPLSFILDTGAYTIVDLKRAQELGAKLKYLRDAGGVGDEPQKVFLGEDKVSFGLPGVTLRNQRLLAISLAKVEECVNEFVVDEEGRLELRVNPPAPPSTRKVDGILGAEFFNEVVVEIDYAARLVNIYDPKNYKYAGNGEKHKLEITPQHIFVKADVVTSTRGSRRGRFMVDTGAAMAVALSKRFTDDHGLLPPAEGLAKVPACGISGKLKESSLLGNVEALQLGSLKITRPVVEFRRAGVEYDFDGYLGGAIFRKYKMIFDYSRRQMIMEG